MHHDLMDWPFRAVTRTARLLRRQGKGQARPYVDIEGYSEDVALILTKQTLKKRIQDLVS